MHGTASKHGFGLPNENAAEINGIVANYISAISETAGISTNTGGVQTAAGAETN